MFSEEWQSLGYIRLPNKRVAPFVQYAYWIDSDGKYQGVSVIFEIRNNCRYDLKYSHWQKFAEEALNAHNHLHIEYAFYQFFTETHLISSFEEALKSLEIPYTKSTVEVGQTDLLNYDK